MERKIVKHFEYDGFGFPIQLLHVPMMKSRGEWTPDVDYNKLQLAVLVSLAQKPYPLTGNEVKFIRKYFRMTLDIFGKEFGVTHVAVLDWEKKENESITINPATEKCIRLFIMDSLNVGDHKFREIYHDVPIKKLAVAQKSKIRRHRPLKVDARKPYQPTLIGKA